MDKSSDPLVADRILRSSLANFSLGLSPAALLLAQFDWAIHFMISPSKQTELFVKAIDETNCLARYVAESGIEKEQPPRIKPLPQDRRFEDEEWQRWPFNIIYQSFLLYQQLWQSATTGVRGVNRHHEDVVSFAARQLIDVFSPSNFFFTNPVVLKATFQQSGMNLVAGMRNLIEDSRRALNEEPPPGSEHFKVGEQLAITPGKVVLRNRLIELIQYSPTTAQVYAEPVLIVPAWIMKYYILDLSPENSLVRYLVAQGHTVFMISWKNPDHDDRDLGMSDYRALGIEAAIDAICAITGAKKLHAVGYCLGGTLLSITAAAMARDGDDRLATINLLAAQVDFEESGELMLFIDESQVSFLEDVMWNQGFLDNRQMAGAFQILRSNDLIWSRMVQDYMLGKRQPMLDLMAWNADATRMPYRMHSEYLRRLYLRNELAEGHYKVGDKPVSLTDIKIPMFAVGTVKDHVAPWTSVYKIHLLSDTEVTFVLTSGGHNAGIVSEPGHRNRAFQTSVTKADARFVAPDEWKRVTPKQDGSWWPHWSKWLAEHSGVKISPPPMGNPAAGYAALTDAPGNYVLEVAGPIPEGEWATLSEAHLPLNDQS